MQRTSRFARSGRTEWNGIIAFVVAEATRRARTIQGRSERLRSLGETLTTETSRVAHDFSRVRSRVQRSKTLDSVGSSRVHGYRGSSIYPPLDDGGRVDG